MCVCVCIYISTHTNWISSEKDFKDHNIWERMHFIVCNFYCLLLLNCLLYFLSVYSTLVVKCCTNECVEFSRCNERHFFHPPLGGGKDFGSFKHNQVLI